MFRHWKIAALSTAILLNMVTAQSGNAQNAQAPEHKGSGNVDNNKGKTDSAPLRVRIIQSQDEAASSEARAGRSEKRENDELSVQRKAASASDFAAKLAGVQSIFGFLSVGLLCWTLAYTRKTANAAARSAAHALSALEHSTTSAAAAMRSADAAERAIETQRAWITSNGIGTAVVKNSFVGGTHVSHGFGATAKWWNTGSSPAMNAMAYANHRLILASESIPTFDQDDTALEPDSSGAVVPRDSQFDSAIRVLRDDEAEKFRAGTHDMVIYSGVKYTDIYGRDRLSEICIRLHHTGGTTQQHGGQPENIILQSPEGPQNTIS